MKTVIIVKSYHDEKNVVSMKFWEPISICRYIDSTVRISSEHVL